MKKTVLFCFSMFVIGASFAQDADILTTTKPASTNIVGQEFPRVDAQGKVYFRFSAPTAQEIKVSLGNVALTKDEKGVWTGVTPPQDPGFHYYTLKIDGKDVADPSSESFFGASKMMSGMEIPEAGVDFYAVKNVPHGEVRSVWYYAASSDEHRHAYIYTPPGYDKSSTTRYPVLYLQHGMGEDRRAWSTQGCANFILDNLIAEGKAKPMIVVMEDGGIAAGMGSAPRRQAAPAATPGATPAAAPRTTPAAAPQGNRNPGGMASFWDGFGQTIVKDLIPFVDANFRTLTARENRAMAGLSLGGTQTYQITQANLDKFASIGIFSAPFGFPGVETGYNGLLAKPAEFNKQVKLFFVSMGSKEGAGSGRSIHESLDKAGIKNVYYEAPGTAHEFQTWRKSLFQFAPLLFK